MERATRIALDADQGVESERTAQVHHRQLRGRVHARDTSRHLTDGAVRNGEKQQTLARYAETGSRRHEARVQGARQAAAEIASARDGYLFWRSTTRMSWPRPELAAPHG